MTATLTRDLIDTVAVPTPVGDAALAPSPSAATSPDFDSTRNFFAGCVGERRLGLLVGPLSPNPDQTMAGTIAAICHLNP